MLPDILHVHYRVVHEGAYGDGHTSETHGVEAQPEGIEHENRDEQREGQGDERDYGGAEIGQEDEEDDDHEDGALVE